MCEIAGRHPVDGANFSRKSDDCGKVMVMADGF